MNSVLQILWTIPEFQERYINSAENIFQGAPSDLSQDFLTQFAKVGVALAGEPHSGGRGCQAENDGTMVTPLAFKTIVGRGHGEFSSSRQQVL